MPSENWKKTQGLRERVGDREDGNIGGTKRSSRKAGWQTAGRRRGAHRSAQHGHWPRGYDLRSLLKTLPLPWNLLTSPISAYGPLSIWDSWGWSQLLLSSWFGLAHRSLLSITSLQSLEVSLPRLSQVAHTPPPYSVSSGHLPSKAVMSSLAQRPQWSSMNVILRCSQT